MSKTVHVILGLQRPLHLHFGRRTILSQESAAKLIEPYVLEFKNRDYAKTFIQQKIFSQQWAALKKNFHFPLHNCFESDELNKLSVQAALVQLSEQLSFIGIFTKLWKDGEPRFIVTAPSALRKNLKANGLSFNELGSRIFWFLFCAKTLKKSLVLGVQEFLKIILDYLATKPAAAAQNTPKVFWLSIYSTFFGKEEGSLNIIDFVKEKRVSCFQEGHGVFLVNSYQDQIQQVADSDIYVGKNMFRAPVEKKAPFFSLLRHLGWQLCSIGYLFVCFASGRWWEQYLGQEIVQVARAKIWFETARPKHLIHCLYGIIVPFWAHMRKRYGGKLWRFFYGTNTMLPEYEGELTRSAPPLYYHMVEDKFGAWNYEQSAWVQSLGHREDQIEICGPIIFAKYPATKPVRTKTLPRIKLGLFDIIPASIPSRLRIGFGEIYFSSENCALFFEDIFKTADEYFGKGKVVFLHKPKRERSPVHDPDYFKLLDSLEKKEGYRQFSPSLNPIQAVLEADVAINFPFSSPANISRYYDIPTSYYDPTQLLTEPFLTDDHPPLLKGKEQLYRWFESLEFKLINQ